VRVVVPLALLGACTAPEASEPEPEGEVRTAVADALRFARDLEPGVSSGFDLDGVVSAAGDGTGCGHADRVSPDGTPGIDNAFAGLLPALEATEASAIEDLVQAAIAVGDLLLLFEVSGIDDPVNDDCVDVAVYRGAGAPLLAPDGTLLDGQTFETDPDPARLDCVPLVDGVIEGGPLALQLEVQVLDVALDLAMQDARMRLALHDDGSMTGVFGGAVPLAGILKIVEEDDLADLRDLVTSLVTLAADLDTAEETCGALSITFEHTAVEAFRY
jgi:hypothetical protein